MPIEADPGAPAYDRRLDGSSMPPTLAQVSSLDASAELAALEVLILDCQATAAGPRGHLLELGWARVAPIADPIDVTSRLVRLPAGERIPPRVARLTGISERALIDAVDPLSAWRDLATTAAALARADGGAPAIIHFASFEAPFLAAFGEQDPAAPPLDVVCTHAVARRLLPELPRRTLRALAGYFGHPVGALRRSGEHVAATACVWRGLIALLAEREDIRRWADLKSWLTAPAPRRERRGYPMPRELRLAAPDRPGLYRMLREGGSVLYVGKATSLRSRVNSYFRRQSGGSERTLEMLSQARDLSFTITESALEAALLEPDEIKRHRPPYNVALIEDGRALCFASRDFGSIAPRPDHRHPIGPLSSRDLALALAALTLALQGGVADPARMLAIPERFAPSLDGCAAALDLFVAEHGAACRRGPRALLALGTRLWRAADHQEDPEAAEAAIEEPPTITPADVAARLAEVAVRAAHAVRRARWLCQLADSAVVWSEPTCASAARLLVLEGGEVQHRADAALGQRPPVPPGAARSWRERRRTFTVATFDRLRVLTTELRRLTTEGCAVEVRFDEHHALSGDRLRRALGWI
jgi:DNA polymerase-3 subunit epsilon